VSGCSSSLDTPTPQPTFQTHPDTVREIAGRVGVIDCQHKPSRQQNRCQSSPSYPPNPLMRGGGVWRGKAVHGISPADSPAGCSTPTHLYLTTLWGGRVVGGGGSQQPDPSSFPLMVFPAALHAFALNSKCAVVSQ